MRKKYSTLTMLVLASLFSMSISGPPALAETTAGITMGTVDSADTAKVKVVKTLQPGDDIPDLLYGTTYTKQTSYNALTISGLTENNPLGTFTAGGYLDAEATGSGTAATGANNNTVTITNTAMLNESEAGTYDENAGKVTEVEYSSIYGGYVTGSTQDTPLSANGNTVTIIRDDRKNDVFMDSVVGGYTAAGEASGNTAKLTGVYIPEDEEGNYGYNNIFAGYNDDTFVAGGQTKSGNAHDNTVTLTNADADTVYGGQTSSGNAYNNYVTIKEEVSDEEASDAAPYADTVYGGQTSSGNAYNNYVTIQKEVSGKGTSGAFGDISTVYGGQTDSGNAYDNHVTLTNADAGTVYGGAVAYGAITDSSDNSEVTLNASAETDFETVTVKVEDLLGASLVNVAGGTPSTGSGSTVTGPVSLHADHNEVTLKSSSVNGNVYGGSVTYRTTEYEDTTNESYDTMTVNVADLLAGNLVQNNSLSEDYMTLEVGSLTDEGSSAESAGTSTALPQLDVSANNNTVSVENPTINVESAMVSVENLTASQLIPIDYPTIYGGYVSLTIDDSESSSTSGIPTSNQVAALANTALAANTAATTLDTAAGANSNTVTIKQTTVLDDTSNSYNLGQGFIVFGGYVEVNGTVSAPLSASRNQVTLTHTPQTEGEEIAPGLYRTVTGGYTTYGDANANKVSLAGQALPIQNGSSPNLLVSGNVIGGMTEEGSANANNVTISVAETKGLVAGGFAVGAPLLTGNALALTKDDAGMLTDVTINAAVSADYNTVSVTSANTAGVYGGLLDEDTDAIIDFGNYNQSNIAVMDTSLQTSLLAEAADADEDESTEVDMTAYLTQRTNNNTVSIGGASSISGNIGGGLVNSTGLAGLSRFSILEEVIPDNSIPTTSAVAITQQANTNTVQLQPSVTVTGNVYGGAAAGTMLMGPVGGPDVENSYSQQADSNHVGAEKAAITGSIYGGTVGAISTVQVAAEEDEDEEQVRVSSYALTAAQDTDFLGTSMVSEENTTAAEAEWKSTSTMAAEADDNTVQLTAGAVENVSIDLSELTKSSSETITHGGNVYGGKVETYLTTTEMPSLISVSPFPKVEGSTTVTSSADRNQVLLEQGAAAAGSIYGGLVDAVAYSSSNSSIISNAAYSLNASMLTATDTYYDEALSEKVNLSASQNTVQLSQSTVGSTLSAVNNVFNTYLSVAGDVYGGSVHFNTGNSYIVTDNSTISMAAVQVQTTPTIHITGSSDTVLNVDVKANQVSLDQTTLPGGQVYGGFMGNAISDVRVPLEEETTEMNALTADQATGNTELLNTSLASSGPFSPSAVDSTVAETNSLTGSVSDNSVWLKNSTVAGKSFSSEDLSAQGVDVDSSVSAIVYGGNVYGGFANFDTSGILGSSISPTNSPYVVETATKDETEQEIDEIEEFAATDSSSLLDVQLVSVAGAEAVDQANDTASEAKGSSDTTITLDASRNHVTLLQSAATSVTVPLAESITLSDGSSTIDSIRRGGSVYGGYANINVSQGIYALGSSVQSTIGYTETATANDNQVYLEDSTAGLVLGGYAQSQNEVYLPSAAALEEVTLPEKITVTTRAEANGNQVVLRDSKVESSVLGGCALSVVNLAANSGTTSFSDLLQTSSSATANQNQVSLSGTTAGHSIAGGMTALGSAVENKVTLQQGSKAGAVIGGFVMYRGQADNNSVLLSDSEATTVYGGTAGLNDNASALQQLGTDLIFSEGVTFGLSTSTLAQLLPENANLTASQNTVTISGGTVGSVWGGYAQDVEFSLPTYTEEDGEEEVADEIESNVESLAPNDANANQISISIKSGPASDNIVNIYGGTITGTITGGQSDSGAADNNIVNIYGGTLDKSVSLYGGVSSTESKDNTLNLYTKGNTVTNLGNFQTMNFYVPADAVAEDTMLTVTGTTDVDGAAVQAAVEDSVKLEKGQHIHLIVKEPASQTENTGVMKLMSVDTTNDLTEITSLSMMPDKDIVMNSGFIQNKVEIHRIDDNTIVLEIPEDDVPTINTDTKLFSEYRASAMNLVNNSSDFAASDAYDGALTAWNFDTAIKGDFTPYLVMGGHDLRADTGSYIDTQGLNANLGFVKRVYQKGYTDTLMPFLEYGNGNYTSHLDDGARGDGDQHYVGAGLLARRDLQSGFHYEALIHAGQMKGDFHGLVRNHLVSYDTSAPYISAMVGAGKIVKKDTTSIDYYGKVFWTHLGSDSVQMHSDLGTSQYNFDSINSYRTRLGFRWTKDVSPTTSYYAGLAWNYEFGGDAQVRYGTFETPTASVKGSSGLLELGWQSKIDKDHDWGADVRVTGWAGVQRGVTYSATVSRAF
ncbi:autotransporter outer membrane beta-barrel domain-containing protein [Megasphaera hominis]|mgnify:CR=1 FL=1|jgi:hypothetical protein|uniref:Autotransporter outer membrane beta-barrel domain-containing protein n=3 Tax=Megasphaera TaxID=906 RepID=A0ABR6VHR4_9FIRM|nr:autotransporter outer membrane beta-barrel domain-containing protein [Megasphaera hominis]MBC3536698.1 autotransporter outer membrane beta-barrel domain-containing protein [Megasphaera hominis]